MKNRLKINPPIELTPEPERKREMARRKRELIKEIEKGMKGPFLPFSLKQFLKETRKRYPELTKTK